MRNAVRAVPAPAAQAGAHRGPALAAVAGCVAGWAVSGLALGEYVASTAWYRAADGRFPFTRIG